MPAFAPGTATHYQMYETATEGTPISPVFDTPEALAAWLTDKRISLFADLKGTYAQWLEIIHGQTLLIVCAKQ